MDHVMLFNKTIPEIGLKARKPTNGPEYQLVNNFIEYKLNRFQNKKNSKTALAVFVEPFLETGFPDMVFAEYNPSRFDQWSAGRSRLSVSDLKVFHHILGNRGLEGLEIQKQLGLESKVLLPSIEKLLDAELIERRSNQWQAKPFNKTFGVKKLIAFEAKMNHWADVFNQALLNQWFASESYVLSPVLRSAEKNVNRSEMLGIGIYISRNQVFKKVRPSSVNPVPSSYASLLFNEWIGRRLSLSH